MKLIVARVIPLALALLLPSYALAETRYPGRRYRAAVITPEEKFMLSSEGLVDDEGRFTLGDAHRLAYRRDSEEGDLVETPWRFSSRATSPEVRPASTDFTI